MASKQLTASVRLNTSDFESKLKRIARGIDALNRAVGKQSNAYNQVNAALGQANTTTEKVKASTDKWAESQRKVNANIKSSHSLLGGVGSKLKAIASTYLGIMGMKAVVGVADTVTSAQNKLNYVNAQNLGSSGMNADGSYTQATFDTTQESMDKMYASSQKVRMGYSEMMSNVSKSMALAGDSFQNNTDNAIRFQEIMAEAYAVGGASAQEMSSSMYQMIQALGAGVLAGDELRSVREGAPLAYKAIEEFAQGVYDCEDSLKDMASQGKITSDMVVAAIMDAGGKMDAAFEQTNQTFAQTWTQIKNAAVQAFRPVIDMLNEMHQKAIDSGLVQKIETLFANIAKAVMIAFTLIRNVITWIADNWNWLQYVIGTALIVLGLLFGQMAAKAIAGAVATAAKWLWANKTLIIIAVAIMALIYLFQQWKNGAIDTCTTIVGALVVVAVALLLIGILIGSIPMIVIAAVIAILALIFMFFGEIMGGIFVVGAFFKNVGLSVANFFIAIWEWLKAVWNNFIAFIVNVATACGNVLSGVFENIGIWWNNICADMKSAFWNFIAFCLESVSGLAPVIEAIASAFGKDISISAMAENARALANDASASRKEYVDLGAAWDEGMHTREYLDTSAAWQNGINTHDTWQDGWVNTAFNNGKDFGNGIKDKINDWGSQFQTGSSNGNILDKLGEKLGLDFSGFGNFPGATDLSGAYSVPEDLLSGIKDDTGDIKDNMELSAEDLEYLRKIAEMEWKKEYTTAEIKVDMSNYNTIDSESDLDGIVTKLTDKLYEELASVANGVYV